MKHLKNIKLPDTLPNNVVLQIGKYLIAEKLGTYSDHIYARITDSDDGYYIVCGTFIEEYIENKNKFDSMDDLSFKIYCDSDKNEEDCKIAIIEAGGWPKFDRRIICGKNFLSFEQMWNVINILQPYIIKSKFI